MKHIKLYEDFIFEIHYTDMFSKKFQEFRTKYLKNNNYNLYVQFTNFKGDKIDKTAYDSPDHHDPVGNYAYPLKYVLNNPADIWYGVNANYIRILERTENCKTLNINLINSEDRCIDYIFKLNKKSSLSEVKTKIDKVKKNYSNKILPKNSGYWGRVFLQVLQVENLDMMNSKIRSSIEQTNILLKAGWDAIEESSKNDSTAIINSREPEQICFLNRKSFNIYDIIQLKGDLKSELSVYFDPNELLTRKWASLVFNIFDDKIKEVHDKTTTPIWYSVKGREMKLYFTKPDSYYQNRNFGQKLHKANKLFDENSVNIIIKTEKGTINYSTDSNITLDNILKDIKDEWNIIKNNKNIENWIPRTNKLRILEEEAKQEEYYKKLKADEYAETVAYLPKWTKKINSWKNILNDKIELPTETEILVNYYNIFDKINDIIYNSGSQNAIEYLTEYIDTITNENTLPLFLRSELEKDYTEKYGLEDIKNYLIFIKKIILKCFETDKNSPFRLTFNNLADEN